MDKMAELSAEARREAALEVYWQLADAADECRRRLDAARASGTPEEVRAVELALGHALNARHLAWLRWNRVCDATKYASR